jgi:hypothetical protein
MLDRVIRLPRVARSLPILAILACGPVVTSDDDTDAAEGSTSTSVSATATSTVGSSTVGSSTVGSSTVGSSTVGSSTGPLDTGDFTTNEDAPSPGFCGDGEFQPEAGEQCDGDDLAGYDCESLGLDPGGVLACDDQCLFATQGCIVCGNGVIDRAEQCDGDNLQGFTCESLGLDGGTLSCAVNCVFDTSGCQPLGCGDGTISPGEQCDGEDLQGFDCESLGLGGGPLSCDPVMCTFDTSMCVA